MDPLSITGFVGASAKVAFDVGTTLYKFARAAKDIDQNISDLSSEATGVGQSLSSLKKTLATPIVRNIHASGTSRRDQALWESVNGSVADCHKTLWRLQKNIAASRPQDDSSLLQKWYSQFRLELKSDDINNLKNQLQTHQASLHTSLLMMEVYTTSLTSGLVLDELLPRISELQDSINSLTRKQRMAASGSKDLAPSVSILENQAKRVISSALTIAEERSLKSSSSDVTNSTGSEYGEPLELDKARRIETWASNAPTLLRNSRTSTLPPNSYLRDSVSSDYPYSTINFDHGGIDEEDDFVFDHIRKYLNEGEIHQRAKNYAVANNLNPFNPGTIPGYKEALRRYDSCHLLALIYMDLDDLSTAETYCMKALQGRWKVKATEPKMFYPSAQLMSRIKAGKGDQKDAKMFADMVPEEHEPIPRQSLHGNSDDATDSLHSLSRDSTIVLPSRPFADPSQQVCLPERYGDNIISKPASLNLAFSRSSNSTIPIIPASEDPLTLSTLIHNNFDPNSKTFDSDLVLYWAAKTGEEHIVRQIIRGFSVTYGQKKNKARVIKAKNLDLISSEGFTPLMAAASRNHLGTVKIILEANAKVYTKTKTDKRTALHIIALRGLLRIIQPLLDAGAEVDSQDGLGNTPLHIAASRGESDMVAALISAGANCEAKTAAGCTPLHLAVLFRQEEVVGTLLHHGAKVDTALFPSTTSPHATPSSVSAFTSENESGPLIPPLQQPTVLHLSATNGDNRILSLLLLPAFKADIEAPTADGRTPLHTAVLAGQISSVTLLLEKGANIDGRDVHGRTALSFAAGMGAMDQAPKPLRRHLSTSPAPLSPSSPSNSSAISDGNPIHMELIRHLLDNGASPLNRETDGCTPLHVAAFEGDLPAARLLLQYGADPLLERAGGLTARNLARKMGYGNLTRLLKDAEKGKGIFLKEKELVPVSAKGKTKILGLGLGRKLTA
ncbi:putative ankyrin repeat protein [Phaeomoniella chlamydospora]|uniref:Putative ankyrin repeat protein n=1 Tax=Phaeomoniella chlamydospora TaxID=158046 RepID=A0A0G2E7X9_PHACM|nr:putative ankyrin repeat protein [Phaeomoniella chlamydospora]